jgi:hypothetical protein
MAKKRIRPKSGPRSKTPGAGSGRRHRVRKPGAGNDPDPRPLAAYRLGYLSFTIRVWFELLWDSRTDSGVWSNIRLAIYQIGEARLDLAREIHGNVFQDLRMVLDQFINLHDTLVTALKEGDSGSSPWRAREAAGQGLWLELRQLADGALDRGDVLMKWYDLGAAIGAYQLGLRRYNPPPWVVDQLEYDLDFDPIIRAAVALPRNEARQIPLLLSLIRLSADKQRQDKAAFLRIFMQRGYEDGELTTRADDVIPLSRMLVELDAAIQDGLGMLVCASPDRKPVRTARRGLRAGETITPEQKKDLKDDRDRVARGKMVIRWDQTTEERNKWVYDEYCKGTRLKIIVGKLVERAKTINPKWDIVSTSNQIINIARSYAKVHDLPEPTRRPRAD